MQPPERPDPGGLALLCLGRRDTRRLLEVYVSRSLSLNDGSLQRRAAKFRAEARSRGTVRSNSDGFVYTRRKRLCKVGQILGAAEAPPTERPTAACLHGSGDPEGKRSTRREKSPSVLKGFLNLFSRKSRGSGSEGREACGAVRAEGPVDRPARPDTLLLTPKHGGKGGQDSHRPQASPGKRLFRLSFRGHTSESTQTQKVPSFRIIQTEAQTEGIVPVEPTSAYYESISQELERIVKEVKESPTEEAPQPFAASIQNRVSAVAAEELSSEKETMEKIISLLKQQGDEFNVKIKDSTGLSSFFQGLSYRAFQQMADRYMEEEIPSELPEDTGGPELVRFAFTLHFTAKLAGLTNQTVGRIMGFGSQYLQDRFTQMMKAQVSPGEVVPSFMDPD